MKIYIMTDLEGIAGVADFEDRATDTHNNHETRMRMRRLLTGEVNAAIDGLFGAGATQVIVNDGHGGGYTIDFEHLDARAQIVHGHERPVWLPLLEALPSDPAFYPDSRPARLSDRPSRPAPGCPDS